MNATKPIIAAPFTAAPLATLGAVLCAVALASCSSKPTDSERQAARAELQAVLDVKRPSFVIADGARGRQVWQETRRLYEENRGELVWSDLRRPRAAVDALLRALHGADAEGLDPRDYDIDNLEKMRRPFDRTRAAELDGRLSYAYLRYAWDLAYGRIDPQDVLPQWHATAREMDLRRVLMRALADNRVESSLADFVPTAPHYQALKRRLALARAEGDRATADHVAMNMDRWRWMPSGLGARYLIVNIPAYRLDVIEEGRSVLSMRVIIGKKDNPTPVLSDLMTSVVLSPYWNIPPRIVEREILPRLAKDPDYLGRQHIETDSSGERYRQRPGPGNALGQVKFVFPNHYNVYMHGTPSPALFDRIERDLSHGCVRLERPLDLAKYVLRDQPEWTETRLVAAMTSGREQSVRLKQPLPVYLVYLTAWDENGVVQTVPDVYGVDRRQAADVNGS